MLRTALQTGGEVAQATAWLAGFTVFYSPTNGGAGRDLIHGIYSEDAWWLYQQLKTRDPHISPTGATW